MDPPNRSDALLLLLSLANDVVVVDAADVDGVVVVGNRGRTIVRWSGVGLRLWLRLWRPWAVSCGGGCG